MGCHALELVRNALRVGPNKKEKIYKTPMEAMLLLDDLIIDSKRVNMILIRWFKVGNSLTFDFKHNFLLSNL